MTRKTAPAKRRFLARLPRQFYLGAALNIAAWVSSWGKIGPSNYTFFALWFGFILALDGINVALRGTSPLTRSRARFAALFLISCPFWWWFELMNVQVGNWHYHLEQYYSPLAYFLVASLNFSTVLPAVMEMSEIFTSFTRLRPRLQPPDVGPRLSNRVATIILAFGILCLVLPFIFPHYAFGLIWLCLAFLLDPINNLARRKSAFGHLLAWDWRFLVAVPLAGITTGFFWEMWNYFALPKWSYTVPFVDVFPHLFEMPLPGFLGYLPFAIELFAMYQFVLLLVSLVTRRQQHDDLTF